MSVAVEETVRGVRGRPSPSEVAAWERAGWSLVDVQRCRGAFGGRALAVLRRPRVSDIPMLIGTVDQSHRSRVQ